MKWDYSVWHSTLTMNKTDSSYVNCTAISRKYRISHFQASGNIADPNSEKVLLIIEQPYQITIASTLAFGPEGYLYAGLAMVVWLVTPHRSGRDANIPSRKNSTH